LKSPMPHANPTPHMAQIPAAVVKPRIPPCWERMMAPAPRKPIPVTTCAAIREGSTEVPFL